MRFRLYRLSAVIIIICILAIVSNFINPPDVSYETEIYFNNEENINLVTEWLKTSGHTVFRYERGDASPTGLGLEKITIDDDAVDMAFKQLFHNYYRISFSHGTLDMEQWQWAATVCGITRSIYPPPRKPDVDSDYNVKLIKIPDSDWYFYENDYR